MLDEICTVTSIQVNLKLEDRLKQPEIEDLKKFIAFLLLSYAYKSNGVPVHHLRTEDHGRLIFNAIFVRNRFQQTLRIVTNDPYRVPVAQDHLKIQRVFLLKKY